VPETNVLTGEKNATAGDIEITLPTYAKVHSFKTYEYNKDTKEFAEGNEQKMNLNFAKFYVHNTYSSADKNKDGLVGIMLPDDSKISVNIAKHTGKDGQVYEGGRYFINANDLREAIKQDYKDFKKAISKDDKANVGDVKAQAVANNKVDKEPVKAKEDNTKEMQ